jgi:hypothetical protein
MANPFLLGVVTLSIAWVTLGHIDEPSQLVVACEDMLVEEHMHSGLEGHTDLEDHSRSSSHMPHIAHMASSGSSTHPDHMGAHVPSTWGVEVPFPFPVLGDHIQDLLASYQLLSCCVQTERTPPLGFCLGIELSGSQTEQWSRSQSLGTAEE